MPQYGKAGGAPPPPQNRGAPPPQHQGPNRWNEGPPTGDVRGRGPPPQSGPIRDDRRFGGPPGPGAAPIGNGRKGPSRFDNDRSIDYGPSEDRFSGPGNDFGRFDGGPPLGLGRDEFGRDIRAGSGVREREREPRDPRDRNNKNERDKERDRRERDRDRAQQPPPRREDSSARSSKRSASPVNSISSSHSRSVPTTNNRTGSSRRFEPVNLPSYSILK